MASSHIAVAWQKTFLAPRYHQKVEQNPVERGKQKKSPAKVCEFMELQQAVMVTATFLHGTILWCSKDRSYTLEPGSSHKQGRPSVCVMRYLQLWSATGQSQANSKQVTQHPGELWQWTACCGGTLRYLWNVTTEKSSVVTWASWKQDLSQLVSICRSYWSQQISSLLYKE